MFPPFSSQVLVRTTALHVATNLGLVLSEASFISTDTPLREHKELTRRCGVAIVSLCTKLISSNHLIHKRLVVAHSEDCTFEARQRFAKSPA